MKIRLISNPVELRPDEHERIALKPMYYLQGFSNEGRIFMQAEAKARLFRALEELPRKYGFLVWDAYRSREVQGIMFDWMKEQVRKGSPDVTDEQVFETARKYMSPPSKVGDEYCPPHLSGGAIDLTLYSVKTGNELLMGTKFDDCSEKAHARFFDEKGLLEERDEIYRGNRALLRDAMVSAGFTVYQYEWWHFDYGNVFWSQVTGLPQLFGPLFGHAEGPLR